MKCSSRHTLAPIDSIFGGQLPPIIPPGARLVEAQLPPLYPGMFTVALREGQLPSLHPLCTSPLGCRFCFLDTPGVHGAKILTEHFVTHFPIFSHTKLLLSLFQRKNKGRLINQSFRGFQRNLLKKLDYREFYSWASKHFKVWQAKCFSCQANPSDMCVCAFYNFLRI